MPERAMTFNHFFSLYCEKRGVKDEDRTAIKEAFYGGAHTITMLFDMVSNPLPLLKELQAFYEQKSAETADTTVH